ncbi:MAG: alpha-2-macroglobulin family protein [Victivallaceae bacterium]
MRKLFLLFILIGGLNFCLSADDEPVPALKNLIAKAAEAADKGNVRDAFLLYKKVVLSVTSTEPTLFDSYKQAVECLNQAGLVNEFDSFAEATLKRHGIVPRMRYEVAVSYLNAMHHGYMIGGNFQRGYSDGGGQGASCLERDRTIALRLLFAIVPVLEQSKMQNHKQAFYVTLCRALRLGREYGQSWRLQYLTDLKVLPDYSQQNFYGGFQNMMSFQLSGAPVDAQGNPVFYHLPDSFNNAVNDGERWRLALQNAYSNGYERAELEFADFLKGQFGVQTMSWVYRSRIGDIRTGPYAVHLLPEDETIAQLANGVHRFKLPDEFNYIKLYEKIFTSKSSCGEAALNNLVSIFTNRRQYDKAAEYLDKSIFVYGLGNDDVKKKALSQIVDNWGEFLPSETFPAGQTPVVNFKYRNATQVNFKIYSLKVNAYIDDIQQWLRSSEGRKTLYRNGMMPESIGNWLMEKDGEKYIDRIVARWDVELVPARGHFDAVKAIQLPVNEPGAYLLEAEVKDGNTIRTIIWNSNLALITRSGAKSQLIVAADALSGKPAADTEVKFFGFKSVFNRKAKPTKDNDDRYTVTIDEFTVRGDANGFCQVDYSKLKPDYRYMITGKSGNRNAVLGFNNFYRCNASSNTSQQRKIYFITDRPVYRPGQTVQFKCWLREVGYGLKNCLGDFAGKKLKTKITSPKGVSVLEQEFTADDFAAFNGKYVIPVGADLGNYAIFIPHLGGYCTFKVEEYKKPEYEVKVVAPEKPVKLGEKIKASIKADYYFGAPVAGAKVTYKVYRRSSGGKNIFIRPWDWLYGYGYWRYAACTENCFVPVVRPGPPELVMQNLAETDSNGKVEIEIDTAPALAFFGDTGSAYEITAEVVDKSRHTVVGKGTVNAEVKSFDVACYSDRGYYNAGDVVSIQVNAGTAENSGTIPGKYETTLYQIVFDQSGQPGEKKLNNWKLTVKENEKAVAQFKVNEPGHYKVVAMVTDSNNNQESDDTIIRIIGAPGKDVPVLTALPLEIVSDKSEYKPGDSAGIMINSSAAAPTIFLFVRPDSNSDRAPEIIQAGHSFMKTITITPQDMPNMFIEAWAVINGKFCRVVKQLVVPPEKKTLNVSISSPEKKYKPGDKPEIKIQVTDSSGKPVQGKLVVSVYDKALEYISGGSNIPDIKPFFWKWLHSWYQQPVCSLSKRFRSLYRGKEIQMSVLGIFGELPTASPMMLEGTFGGGRKIMMAKKLSENNVDGAVADASAADSSEVVVRWDFADSILWNASVTTDAQGEAILPLTLPDNLTAWKIKVWSMAEQACVGQGENEIIVSKDLLVRLELPRFLVEGDNTVISAIVHNYTPHLVKAEVSATLNSNECLQIVDNELKNAEVKTDGEGRVDWRARALKPGNVEVIVKTVAGKFSDGVKLSLPVEIHGISKQIAFSGDIRGEDKRSAFVALEVPEKRLPEQTRLTVSFSPSAAAALVDALPYLVSCEDKDTFSAVNRFIPTLIVCNTLKKLGVDLQKVKQSQTNLNPAELGRTTERSGQWKRYDSNPVFNNEQVTALVNDGLKMLSVMQNGDGGWGWFSGFAESSYPDTTASVVNSMISARMNGIEVDQTMFNRGVVWLKAFQNNRIVEIKKNNATVDNTDALIFYVLTRAGVSDDFMRQTLYDGRKNLSLYGLSLCGLALHQLGDKQKLKIIMENLNQFAVEDAENQTAFLRIPQNYCWWFWYGNAIETQANYLKLLAATEPKGKRAAWLAKYILVNRKHATYWNSVRDTGLCIEALADFVTGSGELLPDMTVEILLDGKLLKSTKVNGDNMFNCDNTLVLSDNDVTSGSHTVEIRSAGHGPLYFNVYLAYFSLEDFIGKAGLDLKVERQYYRLEPEVVSGEARGANGQALKVNEEKYRRMPLSDLSAVKSGDLVEVELVIDSKNDYEYLVFEDNKAAGFEPVSPLSGYTNNSLGAYVEFRDRKTNFFVRRINRGKSSVSYRMRAVTPGRYTALPACGLGIYAPELKGNSDEFRMIIKD